ncbi:MAG: ATP phosphoribosyltransferase regulatory subunit, partial [Deltaproteobacteria bacterium]|nr:ATP phosphoribosyltransferase regulatory subunit [Deltaproteobacteria bacterium]
MPSALKSYIVDTFADSRAISLMIIQPGISLPQGVRDILPDEARKIGAVESAILSVFEAHGFEKVIT